MSLFFRYYVGCTLLLLFATLAFGVLSSFAFLYPELYNHYLPFYQLHPMHVSAALFWIISGATACIIYYMREVFVLQNAPGKAVNGFICLWTGTIFVIFGFYALKKFGGREYWEFPPFLSIPLLGSWLLFIGNYFMSWRKARDRKPLYVLMWSTGVTFFLITFIEQNLWQIPWFRESLLRDMTVQWKANGSMVGAWNQMLYGTSLYIMVKISGDKSIAENKKVLFFYFLSITNLMFNWGHHIYNLPVNSWVRHVSYIISMTEWIFLISIIRGFKAKLEERQKMRHLLSYKFLIASEFWLYANLGLAIMMSIPAINRYTHGTHITVAHAMGSTIGINTMILLAGIGYMLGVDTLTAEKKKIITSGYYLTQVSLVIFWLSLIVAGLIKGYRNTVLNMTNFQEMMVPVSKILKIFSIAGIGVFAGLTPVVWVYIRAIGNLTTTTTTNK
ncbi:MAG: cbb3-type cytochrome c oxidase subunit I [Bacteroidetes bacterium]|nr:cbb3-type cytochrome c oxidase subunit I [Bacteroidota bacterium]